MEDTHVFQGRPDDHLHYSRISFLLLLSSSPCHRISPILLSWQRGLIRSKVSRGSRVNHNHLEEGVILQDEQDELFECD